MTTAAALSAAGIHFSAAGRPILAGIDLAVAPGECLGIIGPNGSGKSTLLRCLYAWHRPAAGTVLLDGADVATLAPNHRARAIAVLAQHGEPGLGLTVAEVVALGRLPHRTPRGRADDGAVVLEALAAIGLSAWAQRPFAPLSGGEKQQVLFARALAQQPTLLILDEPTNHLDIRHQLELLRAARSRGVSLVITLHDLNLAARWCDRLCLLHEGRIRITGPPHAVLTPELIGAVYGVHVERDTDPRTGCPRLSYDLAPAPPGEHR